MKNLSGNPPSVTICTVLLMTDHKPTKFLDMLQLIRHAFTYIMVSVPFLRFNVQFVTYLHSSTTTVVFHTFAGYTPKHCNHNVVNTCLCYFSPPTPPTHHKITKTDASYRLYLGYCRLSHNSKGMTLLAQHLSLLLFIYICLRSTSCLDLVHYT